MNIENLEKLQLGLEPWVGDMLFIETSSDQRIYQNNSDLQDRLVNHPVKTKPLAEAVESEPGIKTNRLLAGSSSIIPKKRSLGEEIDFKGGPE